METIAFILFAAFALLVMVSGSVAIALMFIKYGDSWEYCHFNDKEDKK